MATKAFFNEFTDKMVAGAYDRRMEYAKKAVEAKTDQEIRVLLATERSDDGDEVKPETIKDADLEGFRKELPKLQEFVKGKPGRAQFNEEMRSKLNSAEINGLLLQNSLSLWTLVWLFLGVGSAYKLGTGIVE